jgi:hypothetical protein
MVHFTPWKLSRRIPAALAHDDRERSILEMCRQAYGAGVT